MIHPIAYQQVNGVSTPFTGGAAPQTNNGATIITNIVRPGTLSAIVVASARTSTLTISGNWYISDDNSTWIRVVPMNNAATVVQVTGTGSDVAATYAYPADTACWGAKYARFVAVTGVGVADGTNDKTTISYRYLKDQ